MQVVPFDERSTQTYGQIRAELERQGIVVGSMDMLIASQPISLGLTLVTKRLPNKKIPNVVGASRSLTAYSGQDARTTIG